MEHLAAVEAAERNGTTPPDTPKHLQRSGYGQGREQPPLRAGAIFAPQASDGGAVGSLFRQPLMLLNDN